MTLLRLITALIVLSVAHPAAAAIRAVFVGIDQYAYSQTNRESATFKDLQGAVGDARRIKDALRAAYQLDLDIEVRGKCGSSNATSITLLNACATRDAIFRAWRSQIDRSQIGDTLILYFAGHGSQFVDSQAFDQASGYHDTILPHDARGPATPVEAEIRDTEIREVIDEATAKGINVISIFDSCNSGTATRDGPAEGESRSVPPRRAPAISPVGRRAPMGSGQGYRVHLAAAADGEEAREVGAVGDRAGVFTTALAETLRIMPSAAFADLATEVRLKLIARGHTAQTPQAEGALTASLGSAERRVPLLDARSEGGTAWLEGGSLTGVTAGSSYALYARVTDAIDDTATPVARGQVTKVEATRALMTLDTPLPARTATLVARETAHAFGGDTLRVRNGAADGDVAAIAALLQTMPFVTVTNSAPFAIVPAQSAYKLVGADGIAIAALGRPGTPDFETRLRTALQRVARVQVLLALRTDTTRADVDFCIGNDLDANAFACQPSETSRGPALKAGARAKLIAVNRAEAKRYLYVYAIDEDYAVNLALPSGDGVDLAVASGRPVVAFGNPDAKGRLIFLTLSTDQPIKASVLEQSGAGARDPSGCTTALARALCAAQQGARDPSVPRAGNWTAIVTSATVK